MTPHFSGATYDDARDGARLSAQYDAVLALMSDGVWRTLDMISQATGAPTHSVSARLRDMRKARFGGHRVEREYLGDGLYRYRVTLAEYLELV